MDEFGRVCTLYVDDRQFLSVPNNLSLGLNIYWFNPFEKAPYSAGALLLIFQDVSVLN